MFLKMEILVLDNIIGCYTQLLTNNLGKYNTPNNAYFKWKKITKLMLSGDYVVINKLIKLV